MLTPFYNAMHCKVFVKLLWWRIILFIFKMLIPQFFIIFTCMFEYNLYYLFTLSLTGWNTPVPGVVNGPVTKDFSRRAVSLRCQTHQIPTSTKEKQKTPTTSCKCHPKENVWAMEYIIFNRKYIFKTSIFQPAMLDYRMVYFGSIL